MSNNLTNKGLLYESALLFGEKFLQKNQVPYILAETALKVGSRIYISAV